MATSPDVASQAAEPHRRTAKGEKATAPAVVLPAAGALPLSAPLADTGAVLSGLLYWLAFPGNDVWPLAFVAGVALIISLPLQPTRRAPPAGRVAALTLTGRG